MDDSTRTTVLAEVGAEAARLWDNIIAGEGLAFEQAEGQVRDGMLAIGARLLEAAVAGQGSGKAGPRQPCACGATARFEDYRPKQVQTVVGWITLRRAYYACAACGHGHCPLDTTLGITRDRLSPGVRRLSCRLGALLPFAEAAATLAATARVQLSASTVRRVTEAVGARCEQEVAATIARAWREGLPPAAEPGADRLYVALDGVLILGADGNGHEVKVGVLRPERRTPAGWVRVAASYAAGLEPATAFGQRVALEAHQRGAETVPELAVLGDGAAWIWNIADEHFPTAVQIVDWFHASERVWDLGRALSGVGTAETTVWVAAQLTRLAHGQAATLAGEWQALPCRGEAASVRDEQVTYFTNQAGRMAYDQYRAAGWDIGSGMVEGACKHLIGAREKGPGMRWSEHGAQTVAAVRVLLFNDQWATHDLAA